jgi:hypothetical protein
VAADVLGGGIQHKISAMPERVLPQRSHVSIVNSQYDVPVRCAKLVGYRAAHGHVHQVVGRVGGRFEEDHGEAILFAGALDEPYEVFAARAGPESEHFDTPFGQNTVYKVGGTTVQGVAVQQQIARLQKFEKGRRNGRHAAFEGGTSFGAIPDFEALLQNFHIRIVQAAVNEPCFFPQAFFPQAISHLKECLSFFGSSECKRGCLENRAFYGAFRPLGTVAMRHHQGFRLEILFHNAVNFSTKVG